jgi:hypothetical protein
MSDTNQKADSLQVLQDNSKMFDGTLDIYPQLEVYIELMHNANHCICDLIQFHMCRYKLSNMNLIILLRLEFSFLQRKMNGLNPHLSSQKRMARFAGSVIYAN